MTDFLNPVQIFEKKWILDFWIFVFFVKRCDILLDFWNLNLLSDAKSCENLWIGVKENCKFWETSEIIETWKDVIFVSQCTAVNCEMGRHINF